MTIAEFKKLIVQEGDGFKIHGQMFTEPECIRMLEFFSFMDSLNMWDNADMCSKILSECNDVGARVVFALCVDATVLPGLMVGEDEDRVLAILKFRMIEAQT